MAKTIQLRIDDFTKEAADKLFISLGLDTSTAIRIFLNTAIEIEGIPFEIKRRGFKKDVLEAMEDARLRRNLSGPYKTAEEAIKAMDED